MDFIRSYGSVRGKLEEREDGFFVVCSDRKPETRCSFPEDVIPLVRIAVGHVVTVTGNLTYQAGDLLPFSCEAIKMEVHDEGGCPLSECCGLLKWHLLPNKSS